MNPLKKALTNHISLFIMVMFISSCSHSEVNKSSYKFKPLPNACIDQSKLYQPVSHLNTISSLNAKTESYRPVSTPKGIIAQDFNTDQRNDYIFIESLTKKKPVKARLVVCMSNKNNYIRKLPKFPIHVNTKPDFQNIVERIEWKNKMLILSTFKSEHNWGSDADIKHYRYEKKHQDFILVSQELISSSGDGLRSDTADFYNFDQRSYKTTNNYGNLEEGCKNTKTNGKLILPKPRASLFAPNSMPYLHKVPQR